MSEHFTAVMVKDEILIYFYILLAKYCSLVQREGGLVLLEEIINSNVPQLPYQRVIELASAVRDNVTKWKEINRANNGTR